METVVYRVKTFGGKRHSVAISQEGIMVDGVTGNCLVLRKNDPLLLAEVGVSRGPNHANIDVLKILLSYPDVEEILPAEKLAEA